MLSQFISSNVKHPQLIVFDEAHKYLCGSSINDALSKTIVSTVRQMRHSGTRVVVSTQSPLTIPPELRELVTIASLHRFHSHDWFSFLKTKIPLRDEMFAQIMSLPTGHALMFSSTWSPSFSEEAHLEVMRKGKDCLKRTTRRRGEITVPSFMKLKFG